MKFYSEDLDILARTVFGEARGEPWLGRVAVAYVVLNRVRRPSWWSRWVDGFTSDTVAAVCRKKAQFSCWNPGDPNRRAIEQATVEDPVFLECLTAASVALAGLVPDPTDGADHYHTLTVSPPWSRGVTPVARIGQHLFYKLGPHGAG